MGAFLLLGADSYVLFDDSYSYLNLESYMEGVMPIYPLFLRGNRILFGEAVYLQAVIMEQAVFACVCLMVFAEFIRRRFRLPYWEAGCVFLFSLLPFSTDMPDAMTTQEIVTEGLAYAAFYLFMAMLMKTAWDKKMKDVLFLFLVTLLLSSIRSQLQILFAVCGVIFFYVMLTRKTESGLFAAGNGKKPRGKMVLRIVLGAAGCLLISLAGVWCMSRVSAGYQQMVRRHLMKQQVAANQAESVDAAGEAVDDAPVVNMQADEEPIEEGRIDGEQIEEENIDEEQIEKEQTEEQNKTQEQDAPQEVASQYITLIFARGMYEADYEDYLLFEDEGLRELYLYLYEVADASGCRYAYAKPGLWMWKDIVGGIGSVGIECFHAQNDYYAQRPEIKLSAEYGRIRNANQMAIGAALVKAHWGRVLYHTLMMLPQAFICTVFFQIKRIYLLCHLVTLFLYLSAAALMIWAYADKKVERAYGEAMSAVLGTNLVMVFVISLVFFGQQRYLVYNFGIFYAVYFLLLMQIWKLYGKNWLVKWMNRRKS